MIKRLWVRLDAWIERRSTDRYFIWKLFFLALALRVGFVLLHPAVNLIADMLGYHESAMSLLNSGELKVKGRLSAARPPLYPIFLYLVYYVFGAGNLLAVRLVQAVLGALTAVLTFVLGRKVFTAKVGVWASLFLALYPAAWGFSDMIMTETLFAFLLISALIFLVDLPQGNIKSAFWAGILLGLATLTRTVIYQFPLFLAIALLLFSRKRLALLPGLAILLISFWVVMLPWKARNDRVFGKPLLTTKAGVDFFLYNHSPFWYIVNSASLEDSTTLEGVTTWKLSEVEKDSVARAAAWKWIKSHPLLFAFKGVRMEWNFFGVEREYLWWLLAGYWGRAPRWQLAALFPLFAPTIYILIPLFLWGLVYSWKKYPLMISLLWLIFYNLAVTFVYSGFSRNRMPLNPILMMFAGYALTQMPQILRDLKPPGIFRRKAVLIAAGLLAFVVLGWALEITLDVGSLLHLGFTDPTWQNVN